MDKDLRVFILEWCLMNISQVSAPMATKGGAPFNAHRDECLETLRHSESYRFNSPRKIDLKAEREAI